MATVQRLKGERGLDYTVLGSDLLPIAPAQEFLRYLRSTDRPNTLRAYAHGLAKWWTVLEATGSKWDDFPPTVFGTFLTYLRSGDLPDTPRIGEPAKPAAPSTVQQRAAAVLAMYTYFRDTKGLEGPYDRLYSSRRRARYSGTATSHRPFLEGVGPARESRSPVFPVRSGPRKRPPLFEPKAIDLILDTCASPTDTGGWTGGLAGLRDRLLFAVLADTGMRLGEVLSLRHQDFHIGSGGTPWVEVVGRQDHPHGVRGKTYRARQIFVTDELEALYSQYVWALIDDGADLEVPSLAEHFVFVNLGAGERYRPLRPETVYSRIRAISAKAGRDLPSRWTPHWFRHTHATTLLLGGVDVHVVSRRLGHAHVTTTIDTYGWVTDEAEMRAAAQWRSAAVGWKERVDGHRE